MKKIYDFVYCDGVFNSAVVWYRVKVGASARDRAALRQLAELAALQPSSVLLAEHSAQVEGVRLSLAAAAMPAVPFPQAIMRTKYINVRELAARVRRYPLPLLNSSRVETPVDVPALILSGWHTPSSLMLCRRLKSSAIPSHVKNLSHHG